MLALVLSMGANAQSKPNFKIDGNRIVTVKTERKAAESVKTSFTFSTGDGVELPVYRTSNGSYYVLRTSKKTGKQYKQYLSKDMKNELDKRIK